MRMDSDMARESERSWAKSGSESQHSLPPISSLTDDKRYPAKSSPATARSSRHEHLEPQYQDRDEGRPLPPLLSCGRPEYGYEESQPRRSPVGEMNVGSGSRLPAMQADLRASKRSPTVRSPREARMRQSPGPDRARWVREASPGSEAGHAGFLRPHSSNSFSRRHHSDSMGSYTEERPGLGAGAWPKSAEGSPNARSKVAPAYGYRDDPYAQQGPPSGRTGSGAGFRARAGTDGSERNRMDFIEADEEQRWRREAAWRDWPTSGPAAPDSRHRPGYGGYARGMGPGPEDGPGLEVMRGARRRTVGGMPEEAVGGMAGYGPPAPGPGPVLAPYVSPTHSHYGPPAQTGQPSPHMGLARGAHGPPPPPPLGHHMGQVGAPSPMGMGRPGASVGPMAVPGASETPGPAAAGGAGAGAASSSGTGSTSSNRRVAHLLSEQRRRESINTGFEDLRQALPACRDGQDSKATVLRRAVEYIHELESIIERTHRMKSETNRLNFDSRSPPNDHDSYGHGHGRGHGRHGHARPERPGSDGGRGRRDGNGNGNGGAETGPRIVGVPAQQFERESGSGCTPLGTTTSSPTRPRESDKGKTWFEAGSSRAHSLKRAHSDPEDSQALGSRRRLTPSDSSSSPSSPAPRTSEMEGAGRYGAAGAAAGAGAGAGAAYAHGHGHGHGYLASRPHYRDEAGRGEGGGHMPLKSEPVLVPFEVSAL